MDFDSYLSPFSWRYASEPMRSIFSENHKRRCWRKTWVALAHAGQKAGIVTKAEYEDIVVHQNEVDVPAALEIEAKIRHDMVAELRVFAGQCKVGGGKLHAGATSMDIQDNADVLRQKEALFLLTKRTASVLFALKRLIEKYKDVPCLAYTHLQAAEPTTLGYRFSSWAQDLLYDLQSLEWFLTDIRGKGLKGATGTSASYVALLGDEKKAEKLEKDFMSFLDLRAFEVSTQTYTRKQDLVLASVLSGVAQTLHKIGLDVRLMQMQHEASEPFGKNQVGSSAMPFKRNPMSAERLCSLARLVAASPMIAWENAANNALERTLDDSANRRVWMEQSFLALDEMLLLAYRILSGLDVNEKVIRRRLQEHAPFALTEVLLMDYVKKGASRQEAHEKLRKDAMAAWQAVLDGKPNPLAARTGHVDVQKHVGLSAKKAAAFAKTLEKALENHTEDRQRSAAF